LGLDPQAKALVSSGYSNDPIMTDYAAHGFCAVIPKPYEMQTLGQTLQGVLAPLPAAAPAPTQKDHTGWKHEQH
jgi:hypothetical protein